MKWRAVAPEFLYRLITRVVLRLVPRAVAEILATVFGMWTAILPLLIWAAWSAEVLAAVLLSGAVSITLYAVFAIASAPDDPSTSFATFKQQREKHESERAMPRKSSWRDMA